MITTYLEQCYLLLKFIYSLSVKCLEVKIKKIVEGIVE